MEVLTKLVHSKGHRPCMVKLMAERDALLVKEHKLAQEIQCIKYWHVKGQVINPEATEAQLKSLEKKRQQVNCRLVSLGRQLVGADESRWSYACNLSLYSPASLIIPLKAQRA